MFASAAANTCAPVLPAVRCDRGERHADARVYDDAGSRERGTNELLSKLAALRLELRRGRRPGDRVRRSGDSGP